MHEDAAVQSFLMSFSQVAEMAARSQRSNAPQLSDALEDHLGIAPSRLSVVSKEVVPYRFADYDVALERMAGPGHGTLGVGGGDARQHMTLADMVSNEWSRMPVGQVDWANVPTGPTETRRVMALGLRLFHHGGQPVAVLQRRRSQILGNGTGSLEVLSPDPDLSNSLLEELTHSSTEHSLLRGNVISLEMVGYEAEGDGYRFVPRPDVPAEDVILPEGRLDRVTRHVAGIAKHAATLRARAQHLKRGVLLYGPPGTGKTHTIRHLISTTPEHTVLLLTGQTLQFISQATAIARHLQPSIVVLEDCDLVAMDRGFSESGNPLLFEVLDALDGLDSDADVAFLLTTNRVEVLEEALTQRPGRVDLAVEVPLPDERARLRLLELYTGDIGFSAEAVTDVARRSESRTASFFKELVRRAVLEAAEEDTDPADRHLVAALDALLADDDLLTRNLLGGDPGSGELDQF